MLNFGNLFQEYVDSLARFFPVFREILSAFPFPVLDFFACVITLLLGFAVAKIIISFIG